MHKGQTACQNAEGDEKLILLFNCSAVEKLQAGEQKRPAEQRRALRYEHISNSIDPAKALVG